MVFYLQRNFFRHNIFFNFNATNFERIILFSLWNSLPTKALINLYILYIFSWSDDLNGFFLFSENVDNAMRIAKKEWKKQIVQIEMKINRNSNRHHLDRRPQQPSVASNTFKKSTLIQEHQQLEK